MDKIMQNAKLKYTADFRFSWWWTSKQTLTKARKQSQTTLLAFFPVEGQVRSANRVREWTNHCQIPQQLQNQHLTKNTISFVQLRDSDGFGQVVVPLAVWHGCEWCGVVTGQGEGAGGKGQDRVGPTKPKLAKSEYPDFG